MCFIKLIVKLTEAHDDGHFDGLTQHCGSSIAKALELPPYSRACSNGLLPGGTKPLH